MDSWWTRAVEAILKPKDTMSLAYSVLTEQQKKRFEQEDELDFSFSIENVSRFRANMYKQRGSIGCAIRMIPFEIKSFTELGCPADHLQAGGQAARPGSRHGPDRLG